MVLNLVFQKQKNYLISLIKTKMEALILLNLLAALEEKLVKVDSIVLRVHGRNLIHKILDV